MSSQRLARNGEPRGAGRDARSLLLARVPVTERPLEVAGVSTAVLSGGDGQPIVLLHGQGSWAGMWLPAIAELVSEHRVVAPDLPGLGASEVPGGPPSTDTVMAWLGEFIERTCAMPPIVVGMSLGGSIAARFAAHQGDRLARMVLVGTGGLAGRVRPVAALLALVRHSARPSERSQLRLLGQATFDLDRMRRQMADRWGPFVAYLVDRSATPSVRAANRRLLREVGLARIPPQELARITVPTALIWGRHDRIMRLATAEQASASYGWPLQVVEDAGHLLPAERPEAFLAALRAVLEAAA